jgi:hypothetical protein
MFLKSIWLMFVRHFEILGTSLRVSTHSAVIQITVRLTAAFHDVRAVQLARIAKQGAPQS